MTTAILAFFLSLTITGFGTPIIRRTAIAIDFVDMPAKRKMHQAPMPLMGGVAIFGGAVVAFLLIFFVFELYTLTNQVWGIMIALSIMAGVGLLDDHSGGMSARVKLAGQLTAVAVLVYFGVHARLGFGLFINYAATVLWVVGMSNAVNFLDNMDGACAGISGVAAAFVLLLAALNDQELVAALAAAVFGACLGFLRYNFKPAKIFMGDAGSLFLGFVLATLALQLRFPQNVTYVTWMVPLFVLGMPIFDLSLVTYARLRRGVNPFTTAGKDHTSHRLVQLGFTQREAVLILYLMGGMFGLISIFITQATVPEGYVVSAIVVVLGGWAIWSLDRHGRAQQNR